MHADWKWLAICGVHDFDLQFTIWVWRCLECIAKTCKACDESTAQSNRWVRDVVLVDTHKKFRTESQRTQKTPTNSIHREIRTSI